MKEKSLLVIEDSQGKIYENGLMKSGCEGINSYLLIYNFSWYCIDEVISLHDLNALYHI